MYLANEKFKHDRASINMVEIFALGNFRPFISYSDKDLIKLFDDNYVSYLNKIEEIKQRQQDDVNGVGYKSKYYKAEIEGVELHIGLYIKPIMDDLIEEAFSE